MEKLDLEIKPKRRKRKGESPPPEPSATDAPPAPPPESFQTKFCVEQEKYFQRCFRETLRTAASQVVRVGETGVKYVSVPDLLRVFTAARDLEADPMIRKALARSVVVFALVLGTPVFDEAHVDSTED